MNLQTLLSPYTLPILVLGLMASGTYFWIRRQNLTEISSRLPWLVAATAFWLFAQWFEYLSANLATKIFWDNVQWLWLALIPALFFLVTADIAHMQGGIRQAALITLGLVPGVLMGTVFTNGYHQLFVQKYVLYVHPGFVGMGKEFAIGFWIFIVYVLILLLLGLINLLRINSRSPGYYRNQVRWIFLSVAVSLAGYIVDLSELNPAPHFQFGSLIMACFVLLTAGRLSKLRRSDTRKVSQGLILGAMTEPYLLLDPECTILDYNPPAKNLLGFGGRDKKNKPLAEVAPDLYAQIAPVAAELAAGSRTVITLPETSAAYQARLSVVRDKSERPFGFLLTVATLEDATQLTIDLQRSLSLTKALSKVATQAASVSSPTAVLKTMGSELRNLSINCAYVSIDHLQGRSVLEYVSFDGMVLEPLEKVLGDRLIGLEQHHSLWPDESHQALKDNYPAFIRDFFGAVLNVFSGFSRRIIKRALSIGGITSLARGIYIPMRYHDGSAGIITVWGDTLRESDLPAFSIFGAQVGRVFEQARLLENEQKQIRELERVNALVRGLSQVALRTASTVDPGDVLATLDEELGRLELQYSLFKVLKDRSTAYIQHVSLAPEIMQQLEKLGRVQAVGYEIKRSEMSPLALRTIDNHTPSFIPRFLDEIVIPFSKFGTPVVRQGLRLIGLNDSTSGYFIPIEYADGETGVLNIWGNTLREEDLSIFTVFANQVSSAFESARLVSAERDQSANLQRSQELIKSLSDVAARVLTTSDPEVTMETLGAELKKFGMECLVALLDEDAREAYIRFHSMDTQRLALAEKLTRKTYTNQRLPLEQWPATVLSVFEEGTPVYVMDFRNTVTTFMPRIARPIARRALDLVGVDEDTNGYFLPLEVQGKVFGCLSIWGDALRRSDLPAFTVFANQVAGALENARLYEQEYEQARALERSNTLLNALSRIAAALASAGSAQAILEAMQAELSPLGLHFTYTTTDMHRQTAVIEYVSVNRRRLEKIESISGIPLRGFRIPKALWPDDSLTVFSENRPQFHVRFLDGIDPLFRGIRKSIFKQGLQLAGIDDATPGVFLPMKIADGSLGFLAIWGKNLAEKDIPALTVFVRQVESSLEGLRLFHQAEQEIAERRAAQEALLASREEYRGLFESAHDAILLFDPTTFGILHVNEQACEMYDYPREEFTELRLDALGQDTEIISNFLKHNLEMDKYFHFETTHYRRDGTAMELEVNASVVLFQGRQAIQSINRDVTARKRYERQLNHSAFHDSLTDLPNRALFRDRLAHAIARRSLDERATFAVLFLDLDRFKDVNDSLGHLAGDELLKEVAVRLVYSMRVVDTLARLGGDEFAILLENISSIHEATEICVKILNDLSRPILIGNREMVVSGSIGLVAENPNYKSPDEYLRDADIAMYRAKGMGKARFEIFDASMRASVLERMQIEADLRRALANEEFALYYQPIVEIDAQRICGFEALLRWKSPDRNTILPSVFIPIAEESALIVQIGHWVLVEACKQLKLWQDTYEIEAPFTISVNVSGVQLMQADFVDKVALAIRDTGIHPEGLSLELTESALIRDQDLAARRIRALRRLGVKIYLDDFGIGYSSLSFLTKFDIDTLKIDRKFVAGIHSKTQADLVAVIVTLGQKLGLHVIAEGIETEEQVDYLVDLGCGLGQGFLYSRPLDIRSARRLLADGLRRQRVVVG